MTENIMPRDNFPKIEEVRQIESEIPTFEEFMKTYKSNEESEILAEAEYQDQALHGPRYGPGKSDFSDLCRRIKNELGYSLTCRISCDSDSFYSWKTYTGAIVYSMNGKYRWQVEAGRACGRNGRAFYMIVKCTDGWRDSYPERYGIGGGIYHGWIIKDEFGFDLGNDYNRYSNNIICCGGFAWMPDRSEDQKLAYNSGTLNTVNQVGGSTDGSGELSSGEKKLVKYCFDQYKTKGPGSTIDVPSYYLP